MRKKFIFLLTLSAITIFCGVLFIGNQTGIISLKSYADELTTSVKQTIGSNSGSGTGFTGYYYQRDENDANPVFKFNRLDGEINMDWGQNSPSPLLNSDHFSVRWTGQVQAYGSGYYTFYTTTDDGVKLYVNDKLVIDKWFNQGASKYYSNPIFLNSNQKVRVVMDYYEWIIDAKAVLSWSGPGFVEQVIPRSQVYNDGNNNCGDKNCADNEECVIRNGYLGTPPAFSCESKEPPAPLRHVLHGIVKEVSGDHTKYLNGAAIEVVDKEDGTKKYSTTSWGWGKSDDGGIYNYELSQIVLDESKWEKLNLKVTLPGKQSTIIELSDPSAITATYPIDSTQVGHFIKDIVLVDKTGKLDIIGVVKDDRGDLVNGALVTASCYHYLGSRSSCDDNMQYPWDETSSPEEKHQKKVNFNFTTYDFSEAPDVDFIMLSVSIPPNYYWDKDGDGKRDSTETPGGNTPYIKLEKKAIQSEGVVGQNAFIVVDDIILNKVLPSPLEVAKAELAAWPNNPNYLKYSEGRKEPWCSDFASWVYMTAGYGVPNIPLTTNLRAYFRKNINDFIWIDYPSASQIKPGDVIMYASPGNTPSGYHVAIVRSVSSKALTSIDGNVTRIGDNMGKRTCSLTVTKTGKLVCHRGQADMTIVGVGRPR